MKGSQIYFCYAFILEVGPGYKVPDCSSVLRSPISQMNSGVDVFFVLIIHLFLKRYGDVVQNGTGTNYFTDFCRLHLDFAMQDVEPSFPPTKDSLYSVACTAMSRIKCFL